MNRSRTAGVFAALATSSLLLSACGFSPLSVLKKEAATPPSASDSASLSPEAAARVEAVLEVVESPFPGAGGPAPAGIEEFVQLTSEERAMLIEDHIVEADATEIAAIFRAMHDDDYRQIGCDLYESGDLICGNASVYGQQLYGNDEFGEINTVHLQNDGFSRLISIPSGLYNMEGLTVTDLEEGQARRWQNIICGMANQAVTCWNTETGHGVHMGYRSYIQF